MVYERSRSVDYIFENAYISTHAGPGTLKGPVKQNDPLIHGLSKANTKKKVELKRLPWGAVFKNSSPSGETAPLFQSGTISVPHLEVK